MDTSRLPRVVATPIDAFRRTRFGRVLLAAAEDFATHDGTVYAGGITYYVLLSLFPFIIFLFSVLGFFVADPDVHDRVVEQIVNQLPSGANLQDQVSSAVSAAANNRGLFGIVGIAGAAWSSSAVFGILRRALNMAFDVGGAKDKVPGRLRDLATLFGVVLLVILSTALTAALAVVRALSNEYIAGPLANTGWAFVMVLVPLVVSYFVFLLAYRLIPLRTLPWHDLRLAALIAAVAFELAKVGFSLYLQTFATYNEVYGTLGGAVAFLVFTFLIANITLFAAEIAAEAAKDRGAALE